MNLIIDASNLLHRAFWINQNIKQPLIKGEVFIFLRTFKSYLHNIRPTSCYMCWDKRLVYPSTNFRKQMQDSDYKGNRVETVNVWENEDEISEMVSYLGVKNMFPGVMEADDVIAWLCHNLEDKCMVISTDEDMFQLVNEKVSIFHPKKKLEIKSDNFLEVVGVEKDQYLSYKCIVGDVSDNIKGWFRYGPVKAKKVVQELTDDPTKLTSYSEELQEIYKRNMRLMDLQRGYVLAGEEEVELYRSQLKDKTNSNISKFKAKCEEIQFQDFLKGLDEWENLMMNGEVKFE